MRTPRAFLAAPFACAAAVIASLFFTAFFAPVIFSGAFATSGDGFTQALPTYFGRHPLWEPNVMFGYPLFADPNQAYWYPVLNLFRALHAPFNLYAIAPYVVAAVGMAGFARAVCDSVTGAAVAALTFSLSGFMIAHQGHVDLIHSAAWTPLIFWCLEGCRHGPRRGPLVVGSVAVALSATGGSQQFLVYGGAVAFAYALVCGSPAPGGKRFMLLSAAAIYGFGIGLAAIAIVPTAELSMLSTRAHATRAEYSVFSIGLAELPTRIFFPFFLGATPAPFYPFSGENAGAFTETSNYAGIATLMLGVIAAISSDRQRHVRFWSGVAVVALWFSLGDAAFAAHILYRVPVYGLFRIPGRHAFEFAFAISLLAAFGVAALERRRASVRRIAFATAAVALPFLGSLAYLAQNGNVLRLSIAQAGEIVHDVPLSPVQNPALFIPAIVVAVAVAALLATRFVALRWVRILLVACVALDVVSFAGGAYCRYETVSMDRLVPPRIARVLRQTLRDENQRVYAVAGSDVADAIPSNLSALWRVPDLGGYVSLEHAGVAQAFQMDPTGTIPLSELENRGNAALDVAAVRYVAFPRSMDVGPQRQEITGDDLEAFVGSDALTPQKTAAFAPKVPVFATSVTVVSALGRAAAIPNGAVVAHLTIVDARNGITRRDVVAGRDTSESAFDRPDVRALVLHARAPLFTSVAGADTFVARFGLPARSAIARVEIAWCFAPNFGALDVQHVSLVDRHLNVAYALSAISRFDAEPTHWKRVPDVSPGDVVFENLRARSRAWIASDVLAMPVDRQLSAIRFGKSQTRDIDFSTTAVSRDGLSAGSSAPRARGSVAIVSPSPVLQRLTVRCSQACLLVTSDLWYPGWKASIDGTAARLVRVDYLLRGLVVPAGKHDIAIWFAPTSLLIGAIVSAFSAIALLIVSLRLRRAALA